MTSEIDGRIQPYAHTLTSEIEGRTQPYTHTLYQTLHLPSADDALQENSVRKEYNLHQRGLKHNTLTHKYPYRNVDQDLSHHRPTRIRESLATTIRNNTIIDSTVRSSASVIYGRPTVRYHVIHPNNNNRHSNSVIHHRKRAAVHHQHSHCKSNASTQPLFPGCLELSRVTRKDSGSFTCRVEFLDSPTQTHSVHLTVFGE